MSGKKYITIKHKNIKSKLVEAEYTKEDVFPSEKALSSTMQSNAINTDSNAPFESLLKLISNNTIRNKVGGVASAFNDIIKSGKIENKVAESLLLRYQTPLLRGIVSFADYPTFPSFTDLYDKIKKDGSGLTTEERVAFIEATSRVANEKYKEESVRVNERKKELKEIDGIQINVVETIDDSYDSEIPLKKIEAGFDITTTIHNKNPVYNFTGFITGGTLSSIIVEGATTGFTELTVEEIKEQIIEIRDSKIAFDVDFSEETDSSGIKRKRKSLTNCFFSNLSFSRSNNNINGYDISFSIIPVIEGKIEKVKKIITATSKKKNETKTKTKIGDGNKVNSIVRIKQTNPKNVEVVNVTNLLGSGKYNIYKKFLTDSDARNLAGIQPRI